MSRHATSATLIVLVLVPVNGLLLRLGVDTWSRIGGWAGGAAAVPPARTSTPWPFAPGEEPGRMVHSHEPMHHAVREQRDKRKGRADG